MLFFHRRNGRISTHAPLARCDVDADMIADSVGNFNSRTSCEVRLGGAAVRYLAAISTHAPLARCDRCDGCVLPHCYNFNSRTSCEVRRIRSSGWG